MPIRLLFVLFALLPNLASAAALELSEHRSALRLAAHLQYLLPDQELDFPAASQATGWRAVRGSSLNLGRQPGPVWVRMELRNHSTRPDWRLLVEWPILDLIEVRTLDPATGAWSQLLQAGDHLPLSAWPQATRLPTFPLLLPVNESRWVYLRLHSEESLVAPMQLLTADAFDQQELDQRMLLGLFFGAMLAVLLYNASLFLFTGSRSYIWYTLYLLGVVVYELALSGFGILYLWSELGRPAAVIYGGAAIWSFLAATVFVRRFLRIPHYGGWVLWANNLLLGYWLVALALLVLHPQWLHGMGINLVALFSCFLAMATAFSLWRRGNRSAPLFAVAWGFLILCTLVHVAALQGVLPVNPLTLRIQTLGFFAEFILLSVALAERINSERKARILAQVDLISEREARLASQQQLLEEQAKANEELERRVLSRTAELQQSTRELAQANAELTRLSNTDALTQLANRRHCDQRLAQQVNEELVVMVIDIDHFKRINDTYGHPFGDRCISAVAEVLRHSARRNGDLAARYGGEEFLLLLSGTSCEAGMCRAEHIRAEVAALELHCRGVPVPLTISLGLACHDAHGELNMQALIDAADKALYRAKEGGRNQVCRAP